MMGANTSETSVNVYHTTRRNNPEDSHLHTRRHENLKCQEYISDFSQNISSIAVYLLFI
jgi:hypothetical protein